MPAEHSAESTIIRTAHHTRATAAGRAELGAIYAPGTRRVKHRPKGQVRGDGPGDKASPADRAPARLWPLD